MKTKRKAQKPKNPYVTGRNKAFNDAMAEIGRSSAASPHRNKARYNKKKERQAKQRGWQ